MRSLEALLLREHETRIVSMRGRELPKSDNSEPLKAANAAQEPRWQALREAILSTAKDHPTWSATAISKHVETSHTTVLAVLRKAGIRTRQQGFQGRDE